MSTAIYCEIKDAACATPSACLQTCKATCPPCNGRCNQGRSCSSLTTGNGGNVITKGQPLPAWPKTFEPDYGITRARYTYSLTKFAAWFLAIASGLTFWAAVIYVARHF